jgi:hypothetical protein
MYSKIANLAVIILMSLRVPLFSDAIVPNYHPVGRCATIDNLDSFPDIVLAAVVYAPAKYLVNQYVVKKDSCLTLGYKANTLCVYWAALDHFNQVGLTGLGIPQTLPDKPADPGVAQVTLLTNGIDCNGGIVPDSNLLVREEFHYRLIYVNSTLSVYLAKKVLVNKDQTTSAVTFDPPSPGVNTRPHQAYTTGANAASLVVGRGYAVLMSASDGPTTVSVFDCAGRPVLSFARNCRKGCAYFHSLSGIAAGLYWIRLKTPDGTVCKRQTIFR